MKKNFLLSLLFIVGLSVFAQQQQVGALTIFSEDGDKFYLILNGEKQNNIPLSNIRVEDLTQPFYSAKIIFEDKMLPEISKKNVMVTDVDGIFQDVTYKIKHDKGGMPKLGSIPFSSVPMQQGYVAPANVYVTHFGAPAPVQQAPVVTQTTTTTTVTTGTPNSANLNVNAMGINMNVNISDPIITGTVGTTITETTTINTNPPPRPVNPALKGCANNFAMASGNFASAITTIKNQAFEDSKLSTAKQIAGSNCLSANQISEICKAFSYEDSKLDFAKFAFPRCTDPGNYFTVNNVFNYSSSTEELNEYIQSQR